ncbi:MAG: hypothetical protein M5U28_07570 [Sandaracinaceae bacterium]|nr:hypothetical protein [Sandaracinaceae bacterium]
MCTPRSRSSSSPAHGYLLAGVVYASIAAVVAVVYLRQLWALAVARRRGARERRVA